MDRDFSGIRAVLSILTISFFTDSSGPSCGVALLRRPISPNLVDIGAFLAGQGCSPSSLQLPTTEPLITPIRVKCSISLWSVKVSHPGALCSILVAERRQSSQSLSMAFHGRCCGISDHSSCATSASLARYALNSRIAGAR